MKSIILETMADGNNGSIILVKFKHHVDYDRFTKRIFNLLTTDKAVEEIIDSETGEVLFDKDMGVLV